MITILRALTDDYTKPFCVNKKLLNEDSKLEIQNAEYEIRNTEYEMRGKS